MVERKKPAAGQGKPALQSEQTGEQRTNINEETTRGNHLSVSPTRPAPRKPDTGKGGDGER